MGSGSYGGGGGGGGGWSGGGGGYSFSGGAVVTKGVSTQKVQTVAFETLCKLPKDYLRKQFGSPLVESVYEQLFELTVHVHLNRTWKGVAERYGVDDGPGCLLRWVEAVMAKFEHLEPNVKVRETALSCLEDFLITALGHDIDAFFAGTGDVVMAKLDEKIFKSTAGYFLGLMIWRILEREREATPEAVEVQLKEIAQQKADHIVANFEREYYAKDQVTRRQLFTVIRNNPDWFRKQVCP
jgi:hypothetical protein